MGSDMKIGRQHFEEIFPNLMTTETGELQSLIGA